MDKNEADTTKMFLRKKNRLMLFIKITIDVNTVLSSKLFIFIKIGNYNETIGIFLN